MTDQMPGHNGQVQRLFDEKAATWSAKYTAHGPLLGRLSRLADVLGYHVGPAGTVLDLGCGTGDLARHLSGPASGSPAATSR